MVLIPRGLCFVWPEENLFLKNRPNKKDRNIVYREKFPNVRKQMELALATFIQDEEELEESLQGGDAVWAFIHKQLIEIARNTLKKSEDNLITCQVFADNSQRCEVLKVCFFIYVLGKICTFYALISSI